MAPTFEAEELAYAAVLADVRFAHRTIAGSRIVYRQADEHEQYKAFEVELLDNGVVAELVYVDEARNRMTHTAQNKSVLPGVRLCREVSDQRRDVRDQRAKGGTLLGRRARPNGVFERHAPRVDHAR